MACLWEGRRSYFFLLRNLIARQATCQEVVFFRRGNAYDSLTFKDYIKGNILPQPLPYDPITPLRVGKRSGFRERVEAGAQEAGDRFL